MANGGGMMGGGNTMIIFLIMGAIVLLFFGCNLGIEAICKLTGGRKGGGLFGGGGGEGGVDLSQMSPEQVAELQQQLGVEEFPRVTLTEAMEYIANSMVTDIDKGTFTQLGRNRLFELKADLFTNYKSDLSEIAEFNDVRLQPLEGRSLALYSRLLLEVCRRNGIVLSPAVESAFRTNLFAGTPTPGVVTANRSVVVA
jgi:hypothetical protein